MIFSYYWIFEVFATVGYGDFAGGTKYEYLITLLLEFSGLLVFSWIFHLLSTLLNKHFDYEQFILEKYQQTEIWLNDLEMTAHKSLDPKQLNLLRETISNSFRYDFNAIVEEGEFYEVLSPSL